MCVHATRTLIAWSIFLPFASTFSSVSTGTSMDANTTTTSLPSPTKLAELEEEGTGEEVEGATNSRPSATGIEKFEFVSSGGGNLEGERAVEAEEAVEEGAEERRAKSPKDPPLLNAWLRAFPRRLEGSWGGDERWYTISAGWLSGGLNDCWPWEAPIASRLGHKEGALGVVAEGPVLVVIACRYVHTLRGRCRAQRDRTEKNHLLLLLLLLLGEGKEVSHTLNRRSSYAPFSRVIVGHTSTRAQQRGSKGLAAANQLRLARRREPRLGLGGGIAWQISINRRESDRKLNQRSSTAIDLPLNRRHPIAGGC